MNVRSLVVYVTAFVAGLAGGWTSRLLPIKHYAPIQATRIELVDESGRTRAFIGTDSERDTAVVFLDDQKRERAIFGVWDSSYSPKMVMKGGDGKERVVFHLSNVDDRPMILLGDHERTRVRLGFFPNDAPSAKDEDWGLTFYKPHDFFHNRLAGIGMHRDWNDDKMFGSVYVEGKDGQIWYEPKR